jgi:activator of HSP90 ATPase
MVVFALVRSNPIKQIKAVLHKFHTVHFDVRSEDISVK